MTLRMSKMMDDVSKSVVWAFFTRIGVPVLLAVVIVGVPTAVAFAYRISERSALTDQKIVAIEDEVRSLKNAMAKDREADVKLREDVSGTRAGVEALIRWTQNMENRMNALPRR